MLFCLDPVVNGCQFRSVRAVQFFLSWHRDGDVKLVVCCLRDQKLVSFSLSNSLDCVKCSSVSGITADQFNFPLDDPRLETVEPSVWEELKLYRKLCRDHGGLLSMPQVAALTGCSASYVRSMCSRGNFTSYHILGLKCIPVDEVKEYIRRKNSDLLAKGGRGLKAPSMKELLKVE